MTENRKVGQGKGKNMRPIGLPARYNYIGAFLTFACNLRCPYCINEFGGPREAGRGMSGADWLRGLNRLRSRADLPVTLQGGEPTLHPDFYEIVNGLRPDLPLDLLTNLQCDVEEFMRNVSPERIRRGAAYASIRVSYHPQTMPLDPLVDKVRRLQEKGYSVGIWAVEHPDDGEAIRAAGERCAEAGIDFRTKEFLGRHEGSLFGSYKYPEALEGQQDEPVMCRTSELLIGPHGHVFGCHSDLYAGRSPVGHIGDEAFEIEDVFRPCECFGLCNPCDVKVKTNRFQQFGHTSVEIRRSATSAPLRETSE